MGIAITFLENASKLMMNRCWRGGEKLKTALVVVGWLAIGLAAVSFGLMGALLTDTAPAAESALWMVGEALFPAVVGGQFLFVGLLLLVLGRVLEELARIRMALETRAG